MSERCERVCIYVWVSTCKGVGEWEIEPMNEWWNELSCETYMWMKMCANKCENERVSTVECLCEWKVCVYVCACEEVKEWVM